MFFMQSLIELQFPLFYIVSSSIFKAKDPNTDKILVRNIINNYTCTIKYNFIFFQSFMIQYTGIFNMFPDLRI